MILSPDATERCGTVLLFSEIPESFYRFSIDNECVTCGASICSYCDEHYYDYSCDCSDYD